MKQGEKGFVFVELLIALGIMALVVEATGMTIFQTMKSTQRNTNQITVIRQVQNAGYWISRDAQMAQSAKTENLTAPDFLILYWTMWDSEQNSIYHSVTYSIEAGTDGVGKLKRQHWSSDGINEWTLIADYIYCSASDTENTSKASYQNGELTVKLTALAGTVQETREYRITRRLDF